MIEYPVSFVGLPIGNREDITRRALAVLESVDCICCEDTRNTGMLLSHYGIRKPLLSLHEHNETQRSPEIASRVAFTVLPGPSAVVTALVGSGLPSDAFFFGGFLPVKSGRKTAVLQSAVQASHTSIFYESPFRIVKTVQALAEIDANVPGCVARELTKVFETYHRGSASSLLEDFKVKPPKGEIVLLVGGQNAPRA